MDTKYLKLKDVARFSSAKTTDICLESYISTENMIPFLGGVSTASSVPDVKSASFYEEGDILLSNIRLYFCKIWKADKKGACSNDVLVVKPKNNIDPTFLYYCLCDKNFFNYADLTSKGTKMPRGTKSAIMKYLVPNIPLCTQNMIASILSNYDKLIQNYKKQIEDLQNLASELYKEWFVRFRFPGYEKATFENGIPKGWKFEKLSCICSVTDGTHDSPKSVENGGVPLVTGKSVKNGEVDFSQTYNISIEDHEKIRKRSGLKTGDILFSNIGTVGNACIVNYDREFSVKNMIIFKPTNRDISLFLYYLLINETYQNIFHAQTNGSTQQFLGLDFMRKFKILVPTQTLLSNFGQKSIDIYSQIQICRKKIENCTQQQSLLLPRLMSGKLEVK